MAFPGQESPRLGQAQGATCRERCCCCSLLHPSLQPWHRACAPGQQCESKAGSKCTKARCKQVCIPLIYPPSSFGTGQGVIFKDPCKRSPEQCESLQTRAPQQPKPFCLLARSITSDFSMRLSHVQGLSVLPMRKRKSEEAEGTLHPPERSPLFHPAVAILRAGTRTLTTRTPQLSYFKHGLGLIKRSLIST